MLQDIKTSFGYYYHISEPFNCHSIMKRTLCTTHTHTHYGCVRFLIYHGLTSASLASGINCLSCLSTVCCCFCVYFYDPNVGTYKRRGPSKLPYNTITNINVIYVLDTFW